MQTKAHKPPFKILIVVPVYNHAATLGPVLAELALQSWPILVVNDGSREGASISEIVKTWPQVSLESHAINLGKGAALATGLRFAAARSYTHILTFDADGQHRAVDVPSLVTAARERPDALVIGARDFESAASGDVPGSSKFGRRFSNFWIWVEAGQKLADTQTGLRVYPVDLQLLATVKGRRYAFEVEVLTRALWQGRSVQSVPTSVYYPPRAQRISHFRPGYDNFQLTLTHTRLCTYRLLQLIGLHRPLRLTSSSSQEMKGAAFSSWVIKRGGAGVAYALMIFPVITGFIFRAVERRAISDFYARVQPSWGAGRRLVAAFANYWYFAASIIDRLRVTDSTLIEVDSTTALPPPGSILVGAHYGDWFLIARRAAQISGEKMGLVIDPQKTPAFFAEMAPRWEGRLQLLAPTDDQFGFALSVKELLDDGGRVCFMVDRLPPPSKLGASSLTVDFFAGPTQFLRAPFALAQRLGVPLYFACAIKRGLGVKAPYTLRGLEIWNGQGVITEQELAMRTARILEDQVRRAPQHWFNFLPIW